jgi:hypothetical protein
MFGSIAVVVLALGFVYSCGGSEGGSDGGMPDGGGTQDGGSFAKTAKLTRGPWLGNVTPDGITVRWETDKTAEPVLQFSGASSGSLKGTTKQYTWALDRNVKRYQHSVTLTGLTAASSFTYNIPDLSAAAGGSFATAPDKAVPFTFAVYGDSRQSSPMQPDHAIHKALTTAMASQNPDFYINTGDLVYLGTMDGEWYLFFNTSTAVMPKAPLYPVVGNHDIAGTAQWAALFALPGDGAAKMYYSFDYSNSHFVILCSECGVGPNDDQITWLKADLEAAKKNAKIVNIFALFHDPVYTCSEHSGNSEELANVMPPLKAAGVKAVMAGHNHLYEHFLVDGVTHITLGGGGAPLYDEEASCTTTPVKFSKKNHYSIIDVNGTTVNVKVIDESGIEIESFTM